MYLKMYKLTLLFSLSCAFALPNPDNEPTVAITARTMKKDCLNGIFSPTCLKIGAITILDKLNKKKELTLMPGVTLVKDGETGKAEAVAAELARSLPAEPEERLDKFLLYNLENFLDTHSVKLKLMDETTAAEAKNMIGEGRSKDPLSMGGKKGGMGGLVAMAMMMKGKWAFFKGKGSWLEIWSIYYKGWGSEVVVETNIQRGLPKNPK